MEKRKHRRFKRRFMVRFGEDCCENMGYTINLSKRGIGLTARRVLLPGKDIDIYLERGPIDGFKIKGSVRWSKMYPPHYYSTVQSGMGIMIKEAPAEFYKYLRSID